MNNNGPDGVEYLFLLLLSSSMVMNVYIIQIEECGGCTSSIDTNLV